MKAIKFLLFLFCFILLQSCSLIKYGRSTKVTIESKTEGEPVHLLAIGQKKTYDYSNVTFPFEMKVRHKDIPIRLHAFSDDIDYAPLSINGKRLVREKVDYGKVLGGQLLAYRLFLVAYLLVLVTLTEKVRQFLALMLRQGLE